MRPSRKFNESDLGVALPPAIVAERQEELALRNLVQVAMNQGEFDNDPSFMRAIEEVRLGRHLQDMTQDYYNLVVPKREDDRATGKLHLQKKERGHDQNTSPATMQAIIAAEQLARAGGSKFVRSMEDVEKMARFMDNHVMEGSTNAMGAEGTSGVGRSKPTDEELRLRAAALMIDSNNGYDSHHGRPFNTIMQHISTPRDAGHFTAHIADHSLSNHPGNIGWQNGYENKAQSSAEKIAGQLEREASNAEISNMLFKSLMNRSTADTYLPRRGTKKHAEYMEPINAQVASLYAKKGDSKIVSGDKITKGERMLTSKDSIMKVPVRMAGTRPEMVELASGKRSDSPGDSAERGLYINSGGGNVTIGEGVLKSNGNGKHKNGNGH